MNALYTISVFLHILAAIVWVGGMLFITMVFVPMLRQPDMRDSAATLLRNAGQRFKRIGWACLILLVITGLTNLALKGFGSQLHTPEFWRSTIGIVLAHKIALVLLIIILAAIHDFKIGPHAVDLMQQDPSSPEAQRLRKKASIFGRINLLLSLVVVVLGILLVRIYVLTG